MTLRGPGGGRGRGRDRGRGRGRTQLWEWETYTPGPDVYEQLWRIRKEPAMVTAQPLDECPIPHARTRILHRRQTDGATTRTLYTVQITRANDGEETEEVHLSRILHYVSPAELERYENEQFRLEAEAEAIAARAEADELAQRQLEKNARFDKVAGRGGRTLNGLGLPLEAHIKTRDRPRGGRSRGRGAARGSVVNSSQPGNDTVEQPVDGNATTRGKEDEACEEDEEISVQTLPGLMRSAFVANSAFPVMPVKRRVSASTAYLNLPDATDFAAPGVQPFAQGDNRDLHDIKRPRTGSTGSSQQILARPVTPLPPEAFSQAILFPDRSSVVDSSPYTEEHLNATSAFPNAELSALGSPGSLSGSEDSIPAHAPLSASHGPSYHHEYKREPNSDTTHVHVGDQEGAHRHQAGDVDDSADDEVEEYVVEAIIEHCRKGDKMYYLIKWEGYEDSHDWVPEEDLEGAADLVAEYNERSNGTSKENHSGKRLFFG